MAGEHRGMTWGLLEFHRNSLRLLEVGVGWVEGLSRCVCGPLTADGAGYIQAHPPPGRHRH